MSKFDDPSWDQLMLESFAVCHYLADFPVPDARNYMLGSGFPILCERCTNPMRLDAAYTWHCDTCADAQEGKAACPATTPHGKTCICRGVRFVDAL